MYFLFVWMMNQIFSLKFKITRYNTHITGKCAIAHLPIKKKGILFMEKNINTKELNNLLIKEKLLPNLPKGTLVFQECLKNIPCIYNVPYICVASPKVSLLAHEAMNLIEDLKLTCSKIIPYNDEFKDQYPIVCMTELAEKPVNLWLEIYPIINNDLLIYFYTSSELSFYDML